MARPKRKVKLSFDGDTVRLVRESAYWCYISYGTRTVSNSWAQFSYRYNAPVIYQPEASLRDLNEANHFLGFNVYWCPALLDDYNSDNYKKQEEAEERAKDLLIECLSPLQKVQFEIYRNFMVTSPSGRTYLIYWGRDFNVRLLENNIPITAFCGGPVEIVPIPDMMLAQKLMLENDEDRFLSIANKQPIMMFNQMTRSFDNLREAVENV